MDARHIPFMFWTDSFPQPNQQMHMTGKQTETNQGERSTHYHHLIILGTPVHDALHILQTERTGVPH